MATEKSLEKSLKTFTDKVGKAKNRRNGCIALQLAGSRGGDYYPSQGEVNINDVYWRLAGLPG